MTPSHPLEGAAMDREAAEKMLMAFAFALNNYNTGGGNAAIDAVEAARKPIIDRLMARPSSAGDAGAAALASLPSPAPEPPEGTLDPKPEKIIHDVTIAVTKNGGGVLVSFPPEMADSLDGIDLEDNCITGFPSEIGCYAAKAEFWFTQGYYEGYPADGESEWGYNLTDIQPLARLQAPTAPQAQQEGAGLPASTGAANEGKAGT